MAGLLVGVDRVQEEERLGLVGQLRGSAGPPVYHDKPRLQRRTARITDCATLL